MFENASKHSNRKITSLKTGAKILALVAAAGITLGACGNDAPQINEATSVAPAANETSAPAAPASSDPALVAPTETPVYIFEADPGEDLGLDDEEPITDYGDATNFADSGVPYQTMEDNERFQFSHAIPVGMELVMRGQNGDGSEYSNPNNHVSLKVYGTFGEYPANLVDTGLTQYMYAHNGTEVVVSGEATERGLYLNPENGDVTLVSQFFTGEHYVTVEVKGSIDEAFEVYNTTIWSLLIMNPSQDQNGPAIPNDDIATIDEDALLDNNTAAETNTVPDSDPVPVTEAPATVEQGEPSGDGWFVENDLFGFFYELAPGYELTTGLVSESGQEHINPATGVTVRIYGEYEVKESPDFSGEFALTDELGTETRTAPVFMDDPRMSDSGVLLRTTVNVGTHLVIFEVEGPNDIAWDTVAQVYDTLGVQDRPPLSGPA